MDPTEPGRLRKLYGTPKGASSTPKGASSRPKGASRESYSAWQEQVSKGIGSQSLGSFILDKYHGTGPFGVPGSPRRDVPVGLPWLAKEIEIYQQRRADEDTVLLTVQRWIEEKMNTGEFTEFECRPYWVTVPLFVRQFAHTCHVNLHAGYPIPVPEFLLPMLAFIGVEAFMQRQAKRKAANVQRLFGVPMSPSFYRAEGTPIPTFRRGGVGPQ